MVQAHEIVYLDHNATTPVRPEVRAVVAGALEFCGNPSSAHAAGRAQRARVEGARAMILGLAGAGPRSLAVFTSGATEANALALRGLGAVRVLALATDHASVLNAVPGVVPLPVLDSGLADMQALEAELEKGPALVTAALVNNETGVIQPAAEIAAAAKRHGALFHLDAAQAAGRVALDLGALGADTISFSGHKMGGAPGTGALVTSGCVPLAPQILGGAQEKGLRAGSENVPGILGFAKAAELARAGLGDYARLAVLRDRLEREILALAPETRIFGREAPRAGNTAMFACPGLSSETQMIALDLAGIAVSNGSACASGTVKASHVLKAMGAGEALASSALRVSFGWSSREADVDRFLEAWSALLARARGRA